VSESVEEFFIPHDFEGCLRPSHFLSPVDDGDPPTDLLCGIHSIAWTSLWSTMMHSVIYEHELNGKIT
jgi:hypothetical protein